ncbi:hypothetical protein [Mastigocoleus testarum]|uniref:Lipoprotein n=1 Tax=Mastigocoleus testarum BC008 TaxID=371196 RepID=A0A0V7ZWJ9_9CYAN|nr:hypothetical protein [Mastigocoleus testarum]KST68598.1 hypothetical protein BC008_33655 [Mastigocoleus testarum BC008]
MDKLIKIFNGMFALAVLTILASCDRSPKVQNCKFVDIENPVKELKLNEVDAKGGEVEMRCGDKNLDVAWRQFRRGFNIDPEKYKNNLQALEDQVTCIKDEHTKGQEILCNKPGDQNNIVILNFTYDD